MSSFYVKSDRLSSDSSIMEKYSVTLNSYADDIRSVDLSSLSDSIESRIRKTVMALGTSTEWGAQAMRSMSSGLGDLSGLYRDTEYRILGRDSDNGGQLKAGRGQSGDGNQGGESTVPNSDSDSIWGEDNSYDYQMQNGELLTFHLGDAQLPSWEVYENYDNYFPYDPNAVPTLEDYANWAYWGTMSWGADVLNHLPDGVEAYDHYRNGNGEPLELDFTKAYNEDSAIRSNCDSMVAETNRAVQEMIAAGQTPPFSITSEFVPSSSYPVTENWQKAIGGHQLWVSADVSYDADGNIVVKTVVHAQDRYNFNSNQADIATGTKDEVNGRFEELGWAHSFDTYGEVSFETVIQPGEEISNPYVTSSEGGRTRPNYYETGRSVYESGRERYENSRED